MRHLIAIILIFTSITAFGDCVYNGEHYPEGTEIGPLKCSSDGTWK